MAEAYRKYSTAQKNADGQPVARIGDLYIAGVSSVDEVSVIATDGAITAHVTLAHLDRLGNANYAIIGQARNHNDLAYPDGPKREIIGLPMGKPEAMSLWGLLDWALTREPAELPIGTSLEHIRWTRDRLAQQVQNEIAAEKQRERRLAKS